MSDKQDAPDVQDEQDTPDAPDVDALQAQIAELTKSNEALTTERDEYQAALQLSQDDVTAKEQAFTELSNTRAKENMLIDAGLPRSLTANIVGETKEDWEKSVAAFAELKSSGTKPKRDPAQSADNSPTNDPSAAARDFFAAFFD